MRKYRRITYKDRCQIYALNKRGDFYNGRRPHASLDGNTPDPTRSGYASSSRSVQAPTSSRARRSSSTACGSLVPAASMPARSPSTSWH